MAKEILTKRHMRVAVEGEASSEFPVESGLPQGTALGSLLFLCHINDLPLSVASKVRLFADDCLLYRTITSQQDHYRTGALQNSIHILSSLNLRLRIDCVGPLSEIGC